MVTFNDEEQQKRLKDIRIQEEEDLVQLLAEEKYDLPYINLTGVVIDNDALKTVPKERAEELEVGAFKKTGKHLYIAVRAPQRSGVVELVRELKKKGFKVHVYMASKTSIEKTWSRYDELSYAEAEERGSFDISPASLKTIAEQIRYIRDVAAVVTEVAQKSKSQKISKMLEIVLAGAISLEASDVHIEPQDEQVRLRFRIDGVLQDVLDITHDEYRLVNARIKLLSGIKLTITNAAQDGRFSIHLDEDEVSIRTSTVPGPNGEGIVMRILNPKATKVGLEALGIPKNLYGIITEEIKKPNGMILLTGPTGSGKTTSLYSFLRKIYSPEIKIITIENPIEYKLEGITQTQTEPEKGYTFANGLRAAMRQDPDVVMVGEIRDQETASIAIQAALTGHLVFSTLHTNNAQGVIPRLIDLGVNPKIISSALSLSIAQRLVRTLYDETKEETTPTEEETKIIRDILQRGKAEGKDFSRLGIDPDAKEFVVYKANSTEAAPDGFKGQTGIFEAIKTDDKIEKIITENPSEREIKKIAQTQGILDMKEDGIVKVLHGITTLSEVQKVVDLTED